MKLQQPPPPPLQTLHCYSGGLSFILKLFECSTRDANEALCQNSGKFRGHKYQLNESTRDNTNTQYGHVEYAKPSNFPLIIILVLFVNNKNTEIKQLI